MRTLLKGFFPALLTVAKTKSRNRGLRREAECVMQMKASTMDTLKGLGRLQETFHNFFFSFWLFQPLPGSQATWAQPQIQPPSEGVTGPSILGCGWAQLSVVVVGVGSALRRVPGENQRDKPRETALRSLPCRARGADVTGRALRAQSDIFKRAFPKGHPLVRVEKVSE